MHFTFSKVGLTWVLSLRVPRFGLIHLGSPYWWKPFKLFPRAFVAHCRVRFGQKGKAHAV